MERAWARVAISPNGLVVDREDRFLYAALTFQPAEIVRIEIADPSNVTTYVRAPLSDVAAGLDGMTRDRRGNLYVAANGAGEVWRVDRERRICSLWSGAPFPDGPSAVAFGAGNKRFPRTSLFVVTFAGDLIELRRVLARRAR